MSESTANFTSDDLRALLARHRPDDEWSADLAALRALLTGP
jgi:hypothetical protein